MEIKYLEDDYTYVKKSKPLWWQLKGLTYTASGYGSKIPTDYMVYVNETKRWYRVYCTIYSNSGSCWVTVKGQRYYTSSF